MNASSCLSDRIGAMARDVRRMANGRADAVARPSAAPCSRGRAADQPDRRCGRPRRSTPPSCAGHLKRDHARQISEIFEAAVDKGEITLAAPVRLRTTARHREFLIGTDPQQVTTRFTDFTDARLPVPAGGAAGAGSAPSCSVPRSIATATSPTHNRKFLAAAGQRPSPGTRRTVPPPLGSPPRNRRIFDDRASALGAPFITRPPTGKTSWSRTYRRNMGGGQSS